MGIISQMFSPPGFRRNQAFTEPFWKELVTRSSSGQAVNAESALRVSAVFACLRVIGEGVAQVPFKLHLSRKGEEGSDPATDHPNYRLAYRQPNTWQTSFEFLENLVFQAGLMGNFYCFKNMVNRGRVLKELIPFPPGSVSTRQDQNTGRLIYTVTVPNSGPKANDQPVATQEFEQEAIWHVKGPSWDTLTGMETIRLAREAIGLSLATEEAHALLHANGAKTSGLYSVNESIPADQWPKYRDWVEKQITGKNRFRPFVMDRGAKFTPISMTGVDAEHLATRNHQVYEVCRHFRVIPIMVGLADKVATYASAEQMFLAHVIHTLSPWYRRIEQSADINLLSREDQDKGYYYKFNPNALLRGATKDQAEYFDKLYRMKALNPNEIRAFLELNPYPGGEQYYVEQGMQEDQANDDNDTGGDGDEEDDQA